MRNKELKKLTDRHKEILRRLALGARAKDVAKSMGVSTRHISHIRNSELGREYADALQKRMDDFAVRTGAAVPFLTRFPHLLK